MSKKTERQKLWEELEKWVRYQVRLKRVKFVAAEFTVVNKEGGRFNYRGVLFKKKGKFDPFIFLNKPKELTALHEEEYGEGQNEKTKKEKNT
jgi:hypothetical protein